MRARASQSDLHVVCAWAERFGDDHDQQAIYAPSLPSIRLSALPIRHVLTRHDVTERESKGQQWSPILILNAPRAKAFPCNLFRLEWDWSEGRSIRMNKEGGKSCRITRPYVFGRG